MGSAAGRLSYARRAYSNFILNKKVNISTVRDVIKLCCSVPLPLSSYVEIEKFDASSSPSDILFALNILMPKKRASEIARFQELCEEAALLPPDRGHIIRRDPAFDSALDRGDDFALQLDRLGMYALPNIAYTNPDFYSDASIEYMRIPILDWQPRMTLGTEDGLLTEKWASSLQGPTKLLELYKPSFASFFVPQIFSKGARGLGAYVSPTKETYGTIQNGVACICGSRTPQSQSELTDFIAELALDDKLDDDDGVVKESRQEVGNYTAALLYGHRTR